MTPLDPGTPVSAGRYRFTLDLTARGESTRYEGQIRFLADITGEQAVHAIADRALDTDGVPETVAYTVLALDLEPVGETLTIETRGAR